MRHIIGLFAVVSVGGILGVGLATGCRGKVESVGESHIERFPPPTTLSLSGSASWGDFNGVDFFGSHIVYSVLENSQNTAPLPTLGFDGIAPGLGEVSFYFPLPRDEQPDHEVYPVNPRIQGGIPYVSLFVKHEAVRDLDIEAYDAYVLSEGLTDLPGDQTEYYATDGQITAALDSGTIELSFDVVLSPVPGQMGPEITLIGTGAGRLSIACGTLVEDIEDDGGTPGVDDDEADAGTTAEQWALDPRLESVFCADFSGWL